MEGRHLGLAAVAAEPKSPALCKRTSLRTAHSPSATPDGHPGTPHSQALSWYRGGWHTVRPWKCRCMSPLIARRMPMVKRLATARCAVLCVRASASALADAAGPT